jgi:hypothetical protein
MLGNARQMASFTDDAGLLAGVGHQRASLNVNGLPPPSGRVDQPEPSRGLGCRCRAGAGAAYNLDNAYSNASSIINDAVASAPTTIKTFGGNLSRG